MSPAGTSNLGTFCPDGTDFGGDSEGTKTSEGFVYAGLNTTTALANVPVNVTRTGTQNLKYTIAAPNFSTCSRNNDSRLNITLSNYDSNCKYYSSTTEKGEKTELNVRSGNVLRVEVSSGGTVYLWASRDGDYSNYTTVKRNGNYSPSMTLNVGKDKSYYSYSYTYSITGPTAATDIEFNRDVSDSDNIYLFYPGKGSLKTYSLSSL